MEKYIKAVIRVPESTDHRWDRERAWIETMVTAPCEESDTAPPTYCVACSDRAGVFVLWVDHNETTKNLAEVLEHARFNLEFSQRENEYLKTLDLYVEDIAKVRSVEPDIGLTEVRDAMKEMVETRREEALESLKREYAEQTKTYFGENPTSVAPDTNISRWPFLDNSA